MEKGSRLTQPIPTSWNGFVYILEGSAFFGIFNFFSHFLFHGHTDWVMKKKKKVEYQGPLIFWDVSFILYKIVSAEENGKCYPQKLLF